MNRIIISVWSATLVLGAASISRAADSGDLVYPKDYPHKARASFLYENLDRDVRVTSHADAKNNLNADAYVFRMHTDISPFALLDFDIGAMSAGRGSESLMGGIGLRYFAFESQNWRGGAFAQIRYARDLSDDMSLNETGDSRISFNLTEADAGFLAGYRMQMAEHFSVMPYAGPLVSIVRLSGDAVTSEGSERFRAKEDQMAGLALGLALEFPGMNTVRIEGRFFDEISVSVAASFSF